MQQPYPQGRFGQQDHIEMGLQSVFRHSQVDMQAVFRLIVHCCSAVDALCELGAIDTLLSNFIKPLQGSEIATRDSNGNLDRIHCSLNINTETGRLSARRPNLQNQPALEKDRYKASKPCRKLFKLLSQDSDALAHALYCI